MPIIVQNKMRRAVNFGRYKISQYMNTKHEPQPLKKAVARESAISPNWGFHCPLTSKGPYTPSLHLHRNSHSYSWAQYYLVLASRSFLQHRWRSPMLGMKQPYNKRDYGYTPQTI